ncbi:hypothetical protein C8T65DRAFT_749392 [Cerioporus squamosus]|nr:hypothetical protein C8T65DRAFT_749392 [Cerioporus squamosus]
MFSIPQPAQDQSDADGLCPIVFVTDSPHDLRHVLRKYMPKRGTDFYATRPPTLFSVSACSRLGHKYQMSDLYEQSVQYLKDFYTNDFARWDAHTIYSPPGSCLQGAIVNGFDREDGSKETLTMSDLALCFRAKDRIAEAVIGARLRTFAVAPAPQCRSVAGCRAALVTATGRVEEKLGRLLAADIILPTSTVISFGQLASVGWEIPDDLSTLASLTLPCHARA